MSVTPGFWEGCDGYGRPGSSVAPRPRRGNVVGRGGSEGGDERQDGPTLPRPPGVAEHAEDGPPLPDAARPVRGGLVGGRGAAFGRAAAVGQDAVRLAPPGAPRAVLRFAPPHVRAAGAGVAGHPRAGEGHRVSPGPSTRRLGRVGFHDHERIERHHRPAAVRPLGLPLRADVLELGVGDGVCVGIVRGVVGRVAIGVLGTGWSAAAAPQRFPERGGEQPVGGPGVPDAVS
jgi:hypothetical protein